jgi:hypothetical protein
MRFLHSNCLVRPESDVFIGLPESLVYAQTTPTVSFVVGILGKTFTIKLIKVLGLLFREDFMLIVNAETTEITLVGHPDMGADQKTYGVTRGKSGIC